MAYQVKRSKKVKEELELVDEDGKVVKKIIVDLDANTIVKQLSKEYINLTNASIALEKAKKSKEDLSECVEALGNAVISLFTTVFGEKNAIEIINFYENNYTEMCTEVLPFVTEVIIPKVRESAKEVKSEIASKYNRKARRKLGI